MELNNILKIGIVNEVTGRKVKAGIFTDKNSEYLNYNGELIKNVSIGSFVLIRKGYTNIVGKVEGEYSKEKSKVADYHELGEEINRTIDISIIGSIIKDKFIHGLTNLPMIGNSVYVVIEEIVNQIFSNNRKDNVLLGKLIGYDGYPFYVGVQDLICSHIGIFGNTGSGKSNTLAKIYREVFIKYASFEKFKKNSKFVFFDFNGEYINVFNEAELYQLSTRSRNGRDKYNIANEDIEDDEFWSIILEATDKTQKPFIGRTIKTYRGIADNTLIINKDYLISLIFDSMEKYTELRIHLREIFWKLKLISCYDQFENNVKYNSKLKNYYTDLGYNINVKEDLNKYIFKDKEAISLEKLNCFEKFDLALCLQYCEEISKTFISKEHIGPLLSRARNRIDSLNKIFEVSKKKDSHLEVISLVDLNISMRKIVPLIIAKKIYKEKRDSKWGSLNSSLHLIIDEAHNILSTISSRESDEWKDYRLECFEEIIKEGRKFGTFLTIASQRPSDISDTIISQLHNYFIHRLVNEEDLKKIYKSIAFSDKASNEMIPILPAGGCIFSGIASNFPVLAQIDRLPMNERPESENVNIEVIWEGKIKRKLRKNFDYI